MANQPLPSLPWRLQLGNSLKPAPMAASPAQPHPPASRPIFQSKFGKPETLPQQPPEPSPEAIAMPRFRFGNASSVPSNPSQKTTPPSLKIKPALEPTEQKTLLIQNPKPSNGVLQKEVGDREKPSVLPDEKKGEEAKDHKGNHKKADSKDCGLLTITVAGDNKGATTELISATSKKPETPLSFVNAFINSNVQTINNSILVDTSVTNHDPGVHVCIPRVSGRGDGKNK